MPGSLRHLFRQPFPLYLEVSTTGPVIAGIAVFVVAFLFLFKPFDLSDADLAERPLFLIGFGVITAAVLSLNHYLIPRLKRDWFDEDRWTVGRQLGWTLWNVWTAVTACAFYEFVQPGCPFSLAHLLRGYQQGFLVSILPLGLGVMMAYQVLLRNRLAQVERTNATIGRAAVSSGGRGLMLVSENGTERLRLDSADLLFIAASDNYVTVCFIESGTLSRQLLRSSLNRMEEQISDPHIRRCHRSCIVNLRRVRSISGNANGYRLYLRGYGEPLPVSRRYGKTVLGLLRTLD